MPGDCKVAVEVEVVVEVLFIFTDLSAHHADYVAHFLLAVLTAFASVASQFHHWLVTVAVTKLRREKRRKRGGKEEEEEAIDTLESITQPKPSR